MIRHKTNGTPISIRGLRLTAAALTAAVFVGGAAHGAVIHVNAGAASGGDGVTWASAYDDLQDALGVATDGDELWVAAGTYTPAGPGGDRAATFQLVDGVALYGGFDGTELARDARDPATNATILSGDLNGDDGPSFANYVDNSYHVVTASGTSAATVLDGVTVRSGHADGVDDPICFGGPNHGTPCGPCPDGTCRSLDATGAGIFALGGLLTINDCRVVENLADFQGGGLMLKAGSHALVTNTVVEGNRALDNGGGMYLGESMPTFADCTFHANTSARYAGGTCNRAESHASFLRCTFSNNTAAELETEPGGGAMVNASSSPLILECTFTGNQSITGNGGAIYNELGFLPGLPVAAPVIRDSTFDGNSAGLFGGAVYNIHASEPTIDGCTFTNTSSDRGGIVYNSEGSITTIANSSFTDTLSTQGGLVYNTQSTLHMRGCTSVNADVIGGGTNDGYAGGVYNVDATATITDCSFTGHYAERYAGVLYNEGLDAPSTVTLTRVTASGNDAELGGSAIFNAIGDVVIDQCRFLQNTGSDVFGGSAILAYFATTTITNSTFRENDTALLNGAAINMFVDGSTTSCVNCVFVNNTNGDIRAEGLLPGKSALLTLTNCSFYNDVPGVNVINGDTLIARNSIFGNTLISGGTLDVSHCNVLGFMIGVGNITGDPMFVDPSNGDLTLQAGSPCIDAASNGAVPVGVTVDHDGRARFVDDPKTPDTGEGTSPLVDMGALEYGSLVCFADLDGQLSVGFADLSRLLAKWGACLGCPEDLDGDGFVGFADLTALLAAWGPCV